LANTKTREAGAVLGAGAPEAMVLALESDVGWTAQARFARSVASAIRGHLPFGRYFEAGRRARRLGAAEGAIERATWDWMETSLHPLHGFLRGLDDPRSVVDRLNAFNVRDLGEAWDGEREKHLVRGGDTGRETGQETGPPRWALTSGSGEFRLYACRVSPDGFDDPEGCQAASLASITFLVEAARRRAAGALEGPKTLSGVARELGVERTAAAEAALVFESEGSMSVEDLAKRLGCGKRSLERELQAVGLTAGALRLSSMIVGATASLHSSESLTEISAKHGFADLAHMTRAFKAACGMAPSALRGRAPSAGGSSLFVAAVPNKIR